MAGLRGPSRPPEACRPEPFGMSKNSPWEAGARCSAPISTPRYKPSKINEAGAMCVALIRLISQLGAFHSNPETRPWHRTAKLEMNLAKPPFAARNTERQPTCFLSSRGTHASSSNREIRRALQIPMPATVNRHGCLVRYCSDRARQWP